MLFYTPILSSWKAPTSWDPHVHNKDWRLTKQFFTHYIHLWAYSSVRVLIWLYNSTIRLNALLYTKLLKASSFVRTLMCIIKTEDWLNDFSHTIYTPMRLLFCACPHLTLQQYSPTKGSFIRIALESFLLCADPQVPNKDRRLAKWLFTHYTCIHLLGYSTVCVLVWLYNGTVQLNVFIHLALESLLLCEYPHVPNKGWRLAKCLFSHTIFTHEATQLYVSMFDCIMVKSN